MYFSSLIFLFLYLPAVLACYYVIPFRFRNIFLLLVNLIFYGWGEPVFVIIMALSVTVNYICGYFIEKYRDNTRTAKTFLILSVVISLGFLGVFKYTNFITDILRRIPFLSMLPKTNIALPIGISFYTFQAMSYTIDVYRGDTKAQKSIINFGTYVSFFPQLIAGPIVRYRDIAVQLVERRENLTQFASGIRRFTVGLCKKVLIANQMGVLWDALRPMGAEAGVLGSWVGIIAYAFQIYFDFSAYSDMAIGLGRMFGFEFIENFNYPYISKSITEFWRRWHISLSTWFRDYVYIPLGGNRRGVPRQIFNLFVVWALTGIWHGANVNFLLWGLYFFVLLAAEKFIYGKYLQKLPKAVRLVYAMFFVTVGWVLFYFEDFGELTAFAAQLFTGANGVIGHDALSVTLSFLPLLAAAAVGSTPLLRNIGKRLEGSAIYRSAEIAMCVCALLLCTAALVSQSYNPFLYFRF